jgi:glycosyltransferase involved in cell wall biosynthesis
MKLLFTNSHPSDLLADERAGHLVRARELIAGLQRLGHEVIVVEAAAGQVAQAAASAYHGRLHRLPRRLQLIARDLARLVQSAAHGWKVGGVARTAGCEAIIETHNTASIAGWLASKRSGQLLALDDVTPASEDAQYYDLGLPWLAKVIRRRVVHSAAVVVTVSSAIEAALSNEGVPVGRIGVVPNGTITAASAAARAVWRERLVLSDDQRAVIYVGSFQPFHNVAMFVNALAQLSTPITTVGIFVGDGATRPACEDLAARLGVSDRCTFVGRLDHVDVADVLAAADAAILPGTADYMNPMKLYEYVAAGLPTVAPDQPAVSETLVNLEGVTLFDRDNPVSCAAALTTAVALGATRPSTIENGTWTDRAEALASLLAKRSFQESTR